MPVISTSKFPGSSGAGRCVSVPGARYEILIAAFTGPSMGELCVSVGAVFAAPLDAHREEKRQGRGRIVLMR